MKRIHIGKLNEKNKGEKVCIKGWVDTVREHGKLIFLDIRDVSGVVQTVVSAKSNKGAFDKTKQLTKESSVCIEGVVNLRPAGTTNEKIPTGKIEIEISAVEAYTICPPLPFELDKNDISEEVRLKYRYLDLRRPEMQRNLILRGKIIEVIRSFFSSEGFTEFETPLLAKSTPEGARDYVVPSRVHPGKFYALPQSPQLFKQLLMVAGMEKYYQIARCLRDEDLRADRQPEFTQLDVEMSFIDQEDVFDVVERLMKCIYKEVLNENLKIPFKRIPYKDAMAKYNSDKPDLRKETNEKYAFSWIVDFPLFEYSKEEKKYVAAHHPFCMPNDLSLFDKDPTKVFGKTYDLVLNGTELLSGSIRIHNPQIQQKVFDVLGISLKEAQEKFGFLLNALSYGAPPHGGFAIGLDRFIQIITGASSIREIIAFPKNSDAKDIMLDAPSIIDAKQLKEAHIKLDIPATKETPKKKS
jgi:aspartyl-tRNA synthetase